MALAPRQAGQPLMTALPSLHELTETSEPASSRDMAAAIVGALLSVAVVLAGITWVVSWLVTG